MAELPTPILQNTWVSMAVPSDGSYGIPAGIMYSFPVTCANGDWKIVQGLPIDDFAKGKMAETLKVRIDNCETQLILRCRNCKKRHMTPRPRAREREEKKA